MNADLTEINNLLREKAQVDSLISKMDEQKESIRQYCLTALADIKENLSALVGILKDNLHLFPLNKYHDYTARGFNSRERDILTFEVKGDSPAIRTDLYYTDSNCNTQKAEACMGYFYCGVKDVEGRIEELSKASKPLEWWVDTQNKIDNYTKKWVEIAIRIVKEHIGRIVDERKQQMNDGLTASSKEYVKIVA